MTKIPLPGEDWTLLLICLAYFGERNGSRGTVERRQIEECWREARAKSDRYSPSYEDYRAGGAVRNATRDLRAFLNELCGDVVPNSSLFIDTPDKGRMRFRPQLIGSDIGQFFDAMREVRQCRLPEDAETLRKACETAQGILNVGEFLPDFEFRFGRYDTVDDRRVLASWILDARLHLNRQQVLLSERLLQLAPFTYLPTYENVFVPRDELVAPILRWLRARPGEGSEAEQLPAMVLHGSYGAGKTRLSVEAVRMLGETDALTRYPGGISFLPLDAYFTRPESVPETALVRALAERLRAPEGVQQELAAQPRIETLQKWLVASPPRLLLLDNGESIFTEAMAQWLVRLVNSTDNRLRCLITSRAAYPGLRHLPVEGVLLPPTADEDFDRVPGSRIFLERVRQREPDYAIPDHSLLLTALRQTEGLPLNLELLAGDAWDLGAKGLRAMVEQGRYSSAAASVQRSIDLLSEADRRLFSHLAVFPYDWDSHAAQVICGIDEATLRRWRDRYLVAYDRNSDRWLLRPRIREVTQQLLLRYPSESMDTRQKHGQYFFEVARNAAGQLGSAQAKLALGMFDTERLSIEDAHAFFLTKSDADSGAMALRLALNLGAYFVLRGLYDESFSFSARALSHPAAQSASGERATLLQDIVKVSTIRLNDGAAATPFALDLERRIEEYPLSTQARTSTALAYYYTVHGDLERATAHLYRAEQHALALYDPICLERIYHGFGAIEYARNDKEAVMPWIQKAWEQAQATDDTAILIIAALNLCHPEMYAKNFVNAYRLMSRAMRTAYDNNMTELVRWCFNVYGLYYFYTQDHSPAARFLIQSHRIGSSFGMPRDPESAQAIEACRKIMGRSSFQREADIILSWTTDQAVEFALSLPPPSADSAR